MEFNRLQWTMIVMWAISLSIDLIWDGQERPKRDWKITAVALIITLFIMNWAGLWTCTIPTN